MYSVNIQILHTFTNVVLTVIGYRKPLKLNYCLIAILVLFLTLFQVFSITELWNETEEAPSTFQVLLTNHTFRLYKCAYTNIKVGVAAKFWREKFNFECMQTSEGSNIQTFLPFLTYMIRFSIIIFHPQVFTCCHLIYI